MIGLTIIEDKWMLETVEDWSRVRSPGRARRRRHRHRQNISFKTVPSQEAVRQGNTIIMHPELARKLKEKIDE